MNNPLDKKDLMSKMQNTRRKRKLKTSFRGWTSKPDLPKSVAIPKDLDDVFIHNISDNVSRVYLQEEDDYTVVQKCTTAIESDNIEKLKYIIGIHFQTIEIKNRLNILLIAAAKGSTKMCAFLLRQGFPFGTRLVHENIFYILFQYVKFLKASPLSIAVHFKKLENVKVLVSSAKDSDIEFIPEQEQEVETILLEEIRKRLELKHNGESLGVVAGFRKTKGILVVYKDSMDINVLENKEETVCGRTLIVKNPKMIPPSDENERQSNCILSVEQMEIGKQIINDNAEDLWSHHSNLNIITMQAIPDDHGRDKEPKCCIVLYCTSKGIVPLGQKEFPKTMKTKCRTHELSVKVEEGFFDYCPSYTTSSSTTFHQDLKMGCSISSKNSSSGGTIGPFIEIDDGNRKGIGFLSCAHVLFDIQTSGNLHYDLTSPVVEVVQPEVSSINTNAQPFQKAHTPCGTVYKAVFNPQLEVGVDATAVLITDKSRYPIEGRFAVHMEDNYKQIGFDQLPVFNSGLRLDPTEMSTVRKVVKCGNTTHFTEGIAQCHGAQVRAATFTGSVNNKQHVMKNQIEIRSLCSAVFCLAGDSGSAVFQVNDDLSLKCIGMAIGVTSEQTAIVTPIRPIMEALGVELKSFE